MGEFESSKACGVRGEAGCPSVAGYRCPASVIGVDATQSEAFEKAFAKLVSRAKRLGCELPTYEVVTQWSVIHWHGDRVAGWWTSGSLVKGVRVTGPRPKFAGWSLAATLEPLEGGANLIKSVPGAGELPAEFRTGVHCDHCKARRRRTETFVVRHDDGRMLRVGRQCIRDFLGGDSPENIALQFTLAIDCAAFVEGSDAYGASGIGPSTWPLERYVALVVRETTAHGWLSRSIARDRCVRATADAAMSRLIGHKSEGIAPEIPSDEEIVAARAALAWCDALAGVSDFEHNIATIAKTKSVTYSTCGIAAAIWPVYQRHLEREVERRRLAASTVDSTHVGAVGDRIDTVVVVTAIYDAEGSYGVTHIHTMVDVDGNAMKWFASSKRLNIGTSYAIRGTVKSHGEYKGRKETVLTRVAARETSQKAAW